MWPHMQERETEVNHHIGLEDKLSVGQLRSQALVQWKRKKAWYTLFTVHACAEFPWQPAYYSATLKLWPIFVYMLKAAWQSFSPCETHTGDCKVRNSISLPVTVCMVSFEAIGELN